MLHSLTWSILIGTFVASCVEVTEMVIIVVGVGATRGWRSTWIGVAAGLTVLVGIIAGLGQALQLLPIDVVRVAIGALLLTFGLQWYRQGVIGVAADGFAGGAEEEEEASGEGSGGAVDWTAFVLAFKGVLLEGLEVAFIVVAFGAGGGTGGGAGSGSGSWGSAYIGAAAAFVVIGALGLVAKQQLEQVPGRTLKFGVGGLLSTFGTFWALEGLGVHWPGEDLSLAWLYPLYLASTFAMMLAVRAGLLGPPPESSLPDPGPADASGLAPASAASILAFQDEHGLEPDAVAGPRTQAAVRAVRAERRDGDGDAAALGVDPGDGRAIAALQRRLDLPATGCLDAMTRGALRVVQHPGIVDPLDEPSVRRFQREHGLPESGAIDEATRVAIAATLADGGDPVARLEALDPAAEETVARFQESLAIPGEGDVDDETRGAMRALRAWLAASPLAGGAPRRAAPPATEPDPFDAASVRAFQRRHGLDDRGTIDDETRAAIRWERDHHLSVDPADPDSVRRFQRAHGQAPDGAVGPRTQAAMRAARGERERDDRKEREARYGSDTEERDPHLFDASDTDAVRRFQREHRLRDDGTIGPRTQAAIRSVRRERERHREEDER